MHRYQKSLMFLLCLSLLCADAAVAASADSIHAASYTVTQFLWDSLKTLLVALCVAAALYLLNRRLAAMYAGRADRQFVKHAVLVGAGLFAILFSLLFMPFATENRTALLSLFGIALSALIALSSTTIMGNAIAGVMLRLVGRVRLGDFVRVGGHFGRVTERDLLHIEIQTEKGVLLTVPAMLVLSQPIETLRAESTVVSANVSLGYDVPRTQVEGLLLGAAKRAGLSKCYVLIRELGDYSVSYSVEGVPRTLDGILFTRSQLLANMMDALHQAGIEIASPTLMNSRVFDKDEALLPPPSGEDAPNSLSQGSPDGVVFDKAVATAARSRERKTGG